MIKGVWFGTPEELAKLEAKGERRDDILYFVLDKNDSFGSIGKI